VAANLRKIAIVGLSDETNQLSAEDMESWFWKLASAVAKESHISAVSFKYITPQSFHVLNVSSELFVDSR